MESSIRSHVTTLLSVKIHQLGEWADFLFTLLIYTLQKDKERRNGFASDEESSRRITSSSEEATHPRPCGS